jgi:hypothetical protein
MTISGIVIGFVFAQMVAFGILAVLGWTMCRPVQADSLTLIGGVALAIVGLLVIEYNVGSVETNETLDAATIVVLAFWIMGLAVAPVAGAMAMALAARDVLFRGIERRVSGGGGSSETVAAKRRLASPSQPKAVPGAVFHGVEHDAITARRRDRH